jgi:SAM-dependent methyltransferase
VRSCKFCNADLVDCNYCIPDYTFRYAVPIFFCPKCELKFAQVSSDPEEDYKGIYASDDASSSYDRYSTYARKIRSRSDCLSWLSMQEPAYFAAISSIMSNVSVGQKILEFGSGYGYLTYALNQHGFECTGVEISDQAVEFSKKQFGDHFVCSTIENFQSQSKFDCIVATEVIEHLADPFEFLVKCKTLLNPNGVIVLTTPNKTFFPSDMKWESSLPPIHLWWLSEKSFLEIGKLIELKPDFFDFSQFFNIFRTQVWNVDNLEGNYQGKEINPNKRANLSIARVLSRFPILLYLSAKILEALTTSEYIYAGDKSNTMGVTLRHIKLSEA